MINRERRRVSRQAWWTCAAVVAAQLVSLPVAYILVSITAGLSGLMSAGHPVGPFIAFPVLAIGLCAALLLEYGAALLAASAARYYGTGMHDLPARRVALGAVAGLVLGVIAVQFLDAWEIELRRLGIADSIQFVCRVGALLGATLIGSALGIRDWATMKRAGHTEA